MTSIVLAHAADGEALALRVDAALARAGFHVKRVGAQIGRRMQATTLESAHRVVVIWSRAARSSPALRAAVRRARARGTLLCVPLDSAPPPAGAKLLRRMPQSGAAWRTELDVGRARENAPSQRASIRPARARRDPALKITQEVKMTPPPKARRRRRASGLALVTALVLIAAAFGSEALNRDTDLAARLQGWAGAAFAQIAP
jgi:hypothetical protein